MKVEDLAALAISACEKEGIASAGLSPLSGYILMPYSQDAAESVA